MKTKRSAREAINLFPSFPLSLITCGDDKENDVTTIGMIHIFSFNPPLFVIGISPSRFSHSLISKHQEFTVNLPTIKPKLKSAVELCGTLSGRDIDKFAAAKLTREKGVLKAPLIKECPVNIECKVINKVTAGDHTLFIGEVQATHIDDSFNEEDLLMWWFGGYRKVGAEL